MKRRSLVLLAALLPAARAARAAAAPAAAPAAGKKIVLVAGRESHGFGEHEFGAGCELLGLALRRALPAAEVRVIAGGWPQDETALAGADAVLIYSDGEGSHVINGREAAVRALHERGTGLGFVHYACNVHKGEQGRLLLDAIGGYYETGWSVNPMWIADFRELPEHPVTRGVRPFQLHDEWYFHMRFRDGMSGVTPLLAAVPPEETRRRPDGPHSGNAQVRARSGMQEIVAWAAENPNGSRGFGFTGAHFYWNYAQDDFRRLTLNAIAWLARIEIPAEGLDSTRPTFEEMEALITRRQPPPDWPEKRRRWQNSPLWIKTPARP
jgi:hypothetical protein